MLVSLSVLRRFRPLLIGRDPPLCVCVRVARDRHCRRSLSASALREALDDQVDDPDALWLEAHRGTGSAIENWRTLYASPSARVAAVFARQRAVHWLT